MNRVKRHVEISFLCGIGITLTLTFLSGVAAHLFSYRDLPMMPKVLFVYALAPGALFGELFSGWTGRGVFYIANSAVYALLVFCITTIVDAVRTAESDTSH
jgi:hypothetical protein